MKSMAHPFQARGHRLSAQRWSVDADGFSLIELMVALVIGLGLSLVISNMVSKQEAIRRGVTSANDLGSNSAFLSYTLDRELRNAGAGFSQALQQNYGCVVNASKANAQILPSPTAFPAPFDKVPQTYQLAPVVVYAGLGANGSDVIAVAAGSSSTGGISRAINPKSAALGQLQLANTVGLRGGDLVLVAQAGLGCMLQQVSNGFTGGTAPVLTFGGTYAADVIGTLSIADFSSNTAFVSSLGNGAGERPRFQLFGLDTNGTLRSYDLLQLSQTTTQALVEGVVDLRVRYGIDPTGQHNQVLNWVAPTTAGYTAAELAASNAAAQTNLSNILALRVGVVLRSDLVEKDTVTAPTLSLFKDLPAALQYTYTLPANTDRQRYRALEFTIPLRNVRTAR